MRGFTRRDLSQSESYPISKNFETPPPLLSEINPDNFTIFHFIYRDGFHAFRLPGY